MMGHSAEILSERERLVLNSIVENFVRNATPVGSRYLAKKSGMDMSPATIRNVMMDLEEMGYVTQPHTSAGRIPTDKGYRFYVDSLMTVEDLSEQEKQHIWEHLRRVSQSVDTILEAASHVLARVSRQLGVVLSPRFYQGVFEKMELIPVAEKKILMVFFIKSGLVRTIVMEVTTEFSREVLEKTAQVLNERLHGLTLQEIKQSLDRRMRHVGDANAELITRIVESADLLFDDDARRSLHFGGTNNIVNQPEFTDHQQLSKVLNLLENREILIHLFEQDDTPEKISIAIGDENREELIKHCSLITTSYHIGNLSGTLGVLGPTRIRYSKMVALVDFMAKILTEVLEKKMSASVR
ncbi:MAG: heat-inducible transcriptional repressor HrcA [candidate division KSB1 bacterium]|nr:heat-inducible transcriptional repressor HrcA [candidate division KSB1 bacterium]